ncbi:hypothetical protein HDV04_000928 [Boothiomyces sp. JEL0838]|nr:hypothetical protein HDV04_000879 [Boothiomyces sp. JEL0838]KAJ3314205.1 hypothetical protein HDV04_000928 [Boothiomyces sp. JEL0838]
MSAWQNNEPNHSKERKRMEFEFEAVPSPFIHPSPYGSEFHFGEEQSFSPLMSPAVTPNVNFTQLSLHNQSNQFAPLTSPALLPSRNERKRKSVGDSNTIATHIDSPIFNGTRSYFPSPLQQNHTSELHFSQAESFSLLSPPSSNQLHPTYPATNDYAPLTPSELLKNNNIQTGRKKVVKTLLPDSKNVSTMELLSQKNGQHIGIRGDSNLAKETKVKKTSHKEAEQLRRDKLKQAFISVKEVLPPFKEKNPSKVFILKRAREHVLDLQHENEQQDLEINYLKQQIEAMQASIIESGGVAPTFTPFERTERVGEQIEDSDDN